MPYVLEEKDYLKLWMYFQDRADKIKEAMFKTLTWSIGFAAALLGFIFVKLTEFEASKAKVSLSELVTIISGAGLVICLYSWFMLLESGNHIQSNWKRADKCKTHITNLGEIVDAEPGKRRKVIKIWHQLSFIVVLFGIAFAGLVVMVCL
jgi:hypothetical protein